MMKKKSQVLITSFTTIALCTALISGSTFALFTSEAKTNIAITSGKVNVTTTVDGLKGYSAEWDSKSGAYTYPEVKEAGTFTNGGTFKYDAGKLSLTNITPGDGVEFKLQTTNGSNVAIQYQVVVTDASADPEKALYRALKISVGDDENMQDITSDRTTAVSDWKAVEAGEIIPDITVSVNLPVETTDDLQEKQCDLLVSVYAVQGNGHDETNENIYHTYLTDGDNIAEVFDELKDGDTVVLSDNVEYAEELGINGADATVDLNGKDLTMAAGGYFCVEGGAEVTLTGEGTFKTSSDRKDLEGTNESIVVYNDVDGTTSTLNVDCKVDFGEMESHQSGSWDAKQGAYVEAKDGSSAVIVLKENAELTLQTNDGAAVFLAKNAACKIEGGSINVISDATQSNAYSYGVYARYADTSFEMTDGSISVSGSGGVYGVLFVERGSFTMTGGTMTIEGTYTPEVSPRTFCSAAVEFDAGGEANFHGGTIAMKCAYDGCSTTAPAFIIGGSVAFQFGAEAVIEIYRSISEKNTAVVDYSDNPFYDESGDVATPLTEKIESRTAAATSSFAGTVSIR